MDRQLIFGQNKILNHPEKVANWLVGKDETLITVELDLTNRCNNKCPKCTGWKDGKTQDFLTLDEAVSYLKQIASMGVKGVIFTGGGEPLLHPNFAEILPLAKKLGLHIGLISNGLVLSQYIQVILDNCDWIRVSLDSGSAEIYQKTHGMDSFAWGKVMENVWRLVSQKKDSKCVIGLGYLTGKETSNPEEMENFVKLAVKLGVDYAQFRPFHDDHTDVSKTLEFLIEKYGKIVTASWQKYERFKDKNKRPYDKCYGVNFATTIGATGEVFVCCHMRGIEKYKLGSLKEKTLKEIWKNRQRVFERIDFKDCPLFCRCDEFNRLLSEIKKPKQHIEFL